ncbi:hypothetical protein O4U47_13340, partial [Nocardiopsis sp. LSu2-4]|nr:hypothetical protein [Nocardiopsis suaedae]
MNNDAINRLRVPAAWALLGAVAARMLAGFIGVFGADEVVYGFAVSGHVFFEPTTVGMVALAVFLVTTAPQKTSANAPIVLAGMVMLGLGALMALLTLIMSFVSASDNAQLADGFSDLFSIAGSAAVLAFAFMYLIKVFADPTRVPRAQPAPQMGQMGPMGQPQGFAPPTGGQPAFGADPSQTFAAQPQQGMDPYAPQPQAQQDPYQQAYGQDPAQAYGTGGQPAYGDAY